MFGIEKQDIFSVLWKIREPFELQGSYAFFKLIKSGNFLNVKYFLSQNPEYAYQIDHEKRTTLMYAVQNGQLEIANHLITLGFNVNKVNEEGYSAIYYAIKSNNSEMVVLLLQNGAVPWSTNSYSLKRLLSVASDEIKIAIKNARKVHIACNLCRKFSQKIKIWDHYRTIINDSKVINFLS